MKRFLVFFSFGLLFPGLCVPGKAENTSSLASEADAAYAKREDPPQAKIALVYYERALFLSAASSAAVAGAHAPIELYWKASRAAWWLGKNAGSRKDQLADFQKGIDFARKATELDPDCVEAHFWLGGNEGSYGEAKGVLKSLFLVKRIRREMAEVIRINDHYLGGGAYRVLGVVDYKVPGFAGGSKTRAERELRKALKMDPSDPFTHYYLAELYRMTHRPEKAQAEIDALRTLRVPPDSLPELHMLLKEIPSR